MKRRKSDSEDKLRPEYDLDELEVVAYGSGWNRLRRLRRKGWKRALNPKRLAAIPNPLRPQAAVRKA
jgi:hypothetical protein